MLLTVTRLICVHIEWSSKISTSQNDQNVLINHKQEIDTKPQIIINDCSRAPWRLDSTHVDHFDLSLKREIEKMSHRCEISFWATKLQLQTWCRLNNRRSLDSLYSEIPYLRHFLATLTGNNLKNGLYGSFPPYIMLKFRFHIVTSRQIWIISTVLR